MEGRCGCDCPVRRSKLAASCASGGSGAKAWRWRRAKVRSGKGLAGRGDAVGRLTLRVRCKSLWLASSNTTLREGFAYVEARDVQPLAALLLRDPVDTATQQIRLASIAELLAFGESFNTAQYQQSFCRP